MFNVELDTTDHELAPIPLPLPHDHQHVPVRSVHIVQLAQEKSVLVFIFFFILHCNLEL